jgi:hypothetical protein
MEDNARTFRMRGVNILCPECGGDSLNDRGRYKNLKYCTCLKCKHRFKIELDPNSYKYRFVRFSKCFITMSDGVDDKR